MKTRILCTLLGVTLTGLSVGCESGTSKRGEAGKAPVAKKAGADAPAADPSDQSQAGDAGEDGGQDMYAAFDPRVAKAAKVARSIEADPTRADEALTELGMDREQLDALMYEIAKDPDLTGEYRIARSL